MDTSVLYVLQCEDDKWYVGKSTDVAKRFKQHQEGSGAAWTREYKPIRIVETRPIKTLHDETNLTKDYMKRYGIDNVRGGAYSQVDLPEDLETAIKHEIKSNTETCYNCGKKGHFSNKCPANQKVEVIWACSYCDEEFSTKAACERHENNRCGGQIDQSSTKRSYGSCYRCGRRGHWSTDCYAQIHVNGYDLD